MKKLTLLSAALLTVSAVQPQITYASDDTKVDHYEAKEFSNAKEALTALVSTSNAMAALAADTELDGTKMEKIHQISYTTENAVAKLGAGKKLAAALEEVHLASEEHDTADLKNKFIAYQAALTAYLAKKQRPAFPDKTSLLVSEVFYAALSSKTKIWDWSRKIS